MKIQKKLVLVVMIAMLITLFGVPSVWAQEVGSPTTEEQNATTTVAAMATTTEEQKATTTADTDATTAGKTEATSAPTREEGRSYRTAMIILDRSGKIAVRVTDTNGNPVEGILVGLQLGTTQMPGEGEYTDGNGYAVFKYDLPQDGTYVYCYSETTEINGVIYEAASASVGRLPAGATTATANAQNTATTLRHGSTAARVSQKNTTQKSTATTKPLILYTAPGTTGMEDTFVVLDFCFDSGILDSFGIEEQDFADQARLLLTQENYATIMGDANGILMLSAATSKYEVTDEQLTAALQNDAMLSRINTDKINHIVMDLSMKYREAESGELVPVWNTAEGSYVIQLPVPDSMRSAQTVAVSAVTADGLSEPVMATVSKDGILRFETSVPVGTIVLLGFKSGVLGTLTSHAVWSSLIFLGVGVVCIGIAVFLYVRFVRRPKKAKKKVEEVAAPEEADPPAESVAVPVSDDPADEPLGGLDIFAESNEVAPLKNPADYDIDL